jgi:uncharacterized repeat protein (TIGR01451 family)
VILLLYAALVALLTTIYYLVTHRRGANDGLPVPNIAGLNVKPASEMTPVKWEPSAARASDDATTLEHGSFAPVPITPGSYAPINVSPPVDASALASSPAKLEKDATRSLLAPAGDDSKRRAAMTVALCDAFEGDLMLLPQGMRTLSVSPDRLIGPDSIVHATFVFRNLGGDMASGFRVRFRTPPGLVYAPGSAKIDDMPLADLPGLTALLGQSGAPIGNVPAGSERRVQLAFSVADSVESGTTFALQAAVASPNIPVIGSNIVQLVVHSAPVLQNAKTTLTVTPVRAALPGEELTLSARVHNSGQSSAHDVVVLLPVPAHTTFSADSATVDGKSVSSPASGPFGFEQPMVVASILRPGATIDVCYRVRITIPIEDGTEVTVEGGVCSQEIAEFSLPPATVTIPSAASFASGDTSFVIDCPNNGVDAGERVRFTLHAKNVGTAAARKVSLVIALPDGVLYAPGSLTVDGAPTCDDGIAPHAVALGDLESGQAVEFALSATVRSPIANGRELRATAMISWDKGPRVLEQTVVVRSAPRFAPKFNKFVPHSARRVKPEDVVTSTISIQNTGTDVATDVRLMLAVDAGLEHVRIFEQETQVAYDGRVSLGNLEPGIQRSLRIEARIARVIQDGKELKLAASLSAAKIAPVDLGAQVYTVTARPSFSKAGSHISMSRDQQLRFMETASLRLVLANAGSDRARDVRVFLDLPNELELEAVDGKPTQDGNAIALGDIAAGASLESQLTIRLVGSMSRGGPLTLAARIRGANVVPLKLDPIEIASSRGASFADGATLTSSPSGTVDAGGMLEYTLSMRNTGDVMAKGLTARITALTNAVYAQGSTSVNGIALADRDGSSELLGQHGLRLAGVDAGVDIIVRWKAIVNMPLPSTAKVEAAAAIGWDDMPELAVVATPIGVRSAAALPISDPSLSFSILNAAAAPARLATIPNRSIRGELTLRRAKDRVLHVNGRASSGEGGPRPIETIDHPPITDSDAS